MFLLWWGEPHTFCVLTLNICVLVYIFGSFILNCIFKTALQLFEFMALFWFNCKIILTFTRSFHFWKLSHLLCWKWLFFYKIWVSVSINTDELNSDLNRTNMNVHLRREHMKLHRQYVNCLHLDVISHLSNWFFCTDHFIQEKVCSHVRLKCQCLVWWSSLEPCTKKPRMF